MATKILYVIDKMFRGGAQRHLVQAVSGLNRGEFEPLLCCLLQRGPLADEIEKMGVRVETLGLENITGMRFPRAVIGLRRIIRREGIGLVHSYLFAANIVSPWAAFLCGIPVITSRRDTGFWKKPRHILLHRFSNLVTDRMTANSLPVADYLRQREKVRAEKIVLIRNGLEMAGDIPGVSSRAKAEGELTLGCLGNIRPVKGYEHLISALGNLKSEGLSLKLHIGGRTLERDYHKRLTALVEQNRLGDFVRFAGEIEDAGAFLRKIDIFVLPSLSEGFSNSLLEAMAAGLPVVATDVGGNREAVEDGVSGFIVPPADVDSLAKRIHDLARDDDLRTTLGQRARERVRRDFSSEKMCSEFRKLYRELLARGGKAGKPAA